MKKTLTRFAASGLIAAVALAGVAAYAQTTTTTTTTTNVIYVTTGAGVYNILGGRDMSVGATGPDVAFLQGLLIELGFLSVPQGIPLGYYGPLTRSAVAKYQATRGVINTGYFGPLTKQAMTAHFGAMNWLTTLFPAAF